MSELTPDEEALQHWLDARPHLVSGDGSTVRDAETGRRDRTSTAAFTQIPPSLRFAEIKCFRKRRSSLLAIVLGSRRTPVIVKGGAGGGGDELARIGDDMLLPCQCGQDHVIDGMLLRGRLSDLARKPGGKPLWIDIAEVERIE